MPAEKKVKMDNAAYTIGCVYALTAPGKKMELKYVPIPIRPPPIGKALTLEDLYGSGTAVKAKEVGWKTATEAEGADADELSEKSARLKLLKLLMFRWNHLTDTHCVTACLRIGLKPGSAILEVLKNEAKDSAKSLQNKLIGMPDNNWTIETLNTNDHWLVLFVIWVVQTYNMKAHLFNLKVAHCDGLRTKAGPLHLAWIISEHQRIRQDWVRELTNEKASLQTQLESLSSSSTPKRRRLPLSSPAGSTSSPGKTFTKANKYDFLMRRVSQIDNLTSWLMNTHGGGITSPQVTAAEDVPFPMPYYVEMQETAKLALWAEQIGRDEIFRFYFPLRDTVAVVENLEQSPFGAMMRTTLQHVSMAVWSDIVCPQLKNLQARNGGQNSPFVAAVGKYDFHTLDADSVRATFRHVPTLMKNADPGFPDGVDEILVSFSVRNDGKPSTPSKSKGKAEARAARWGIMG